MKLPEIFALTRREQRAVILIVIALLATTITKYYREQQRAVVPAVSTPAEARAAPSTISEDEVSEPAD